MHKYECESEEVCREYDYESECWVQVRYKCEYEYDLSVPLWMSAWTRIYVWKWVGRSVNMNVSVSLS